MDLNEAGIKVVKINDKKSAKSFGILSSPGLTYFKGGKGDNFEGELTDGEALMDFLASPEAMELPDQIEEVNAKQLDILVQEKQFVAVIFCKYRCRYRVSHIEMVFSKLQKKIVGKSIIVKTWSYFQENLITF